MGSKNDTVGPPTNHWETDCDFSGGCFAAQIVEDKDVHVLYKLDRLGNGRHVKLCWTCLGGTRASMRIKHMLSMHGFNEQRQTTTSRQFCHFNFLIMLIQETYRKLMRMVSHNIFLDLDFHQLSFFCSASFSRNINFSLSNSLQWCWVLWFSRTCCGLFLPFTARRIWCCRSRIFRAPSIHESKLEIGSQALTLTTCQARISKISHQPGNRSLIVPREWNLMSEVLVLGVGKRGF